MDSLSLHIFKDKLDIFQRQSRSGIGTLWPAEPLDPAHRPGSRVQWCLAVGDFSGIWQWGISPLLHHTVSHLGDGVLQQGSRDK